MTLVLRVPCHVATRVTMIGRLLCVLKGEYRQTACQFKHHLVGNVHNTERKKLENRTSSKVLMGI